MTEQIIYFSLEQFSQQVPLAPEHIVEIVHLGIVEPAGREQRNWQFDIDMLATARQAWRLHRQLEIDWPGVALAMQLLQQIDDLKRENERLRAQLRRFIVID
ncbi:chaperone modulator CbpM [Halioxenophilus sp. WMMB6]|uniref:chaperone modulator CbpM n=1 Tax=Halioxenophilus sp. WMMB6 TaxID=3073815 RepID=UPI00295E4E04|nr:chaperone modulator CbpM [Halioxenophilus sp. WMMB6]